MTKNEIGPLEIIEQKIFLIREQKVMIDRDLAELYGVETKYLNRQVKRNRDRFPEEFMFQLTEQEKIELVTNWHRFKTLKHSTMSPYAFTENGVAMLASVLKSEKAVKISIYIIKTFIRLRKWVLTNKEMAEKLKAIENKIQDHDQKIQELFEAIIKIISIPEKPKRQIGFHSAEAQ